MKKLFASVAALAVALAAGLYAADTVTHVGDANNGNLPVGLRLADNGDSSYSVAALTGNQSTQNKTIEASVAHTSLAANSTAVSGLGKYSVLQFQLDVTAAATEAQDTGDVFIQTTIDGSNWLDVVHFTQLLGNGGAKRFIAKVNGTEPQTMYETGTALAAGSVRNILGDQYRVRWALVDGNANANQSFTWSVKANASGN